MDTVARKMAEKAIIESMSDEVTCKDILTKAYTAGLFTEAEVDIIVKDIKAWSERSAEKTSSPEQLRISRALLRALGAFPALTLVLLIKQFPERSIGDGWMVPDVDGACKALKYEPFQFHQILNIFKDKDILEKKIDKRIKKLVIRLNFFTIQSIYEENDEEPTEEHGDSLEV